jgi:hypothetical protein
MIEYRVRTVERFIVTRFESRDDGSAAAGDVRQIGNEFPSGDTAYEVAYALARQEAELKGYGPTDTRIVYPSHPNETGEMLVNPRALSSVVSAV